MKFKLGQEITPRRDKWNVVFPGLNPAQIPVFGMIYTVKLYPFADRPDYFKHKYLLLAEIDTGLFNEDSFEPLVSSDQLEEDLNEIFILGQKLADG